MANILVVEDEQPLREVYRTILRVGGYEPDDAADGAAALKLCRQKHYTLILLDLMMPGVDGVSFLRQAQLRDKSPGTVVILFTNVSSGKDVERALALGAHSHILKSSMTPVDLLQLVGRFT